MTDLNNDKKIEYIIKGGRPFGEIGTKHINRQITLLERTDNSLNPIPHINGDVTKNKYDNLLNTTYRSNLGDLLCYNEKKEFNRNEIVRSMVELEKINKASVDLTREIRESLSWLDHEGECLPHFDKKIECKVGSKWRRNHSGVKTKAEVKVMMWHTLLNTKKGGLYRSVCVMGDLTFKFKDLIFFDLEDRILVLSEKNETDAYSRRSRGGYKGIKGKGAKRHLEDLDDLDQMKRYEDYWKLIGE